MFGELSELLCRSIRAKTGVVKYFDMELSQFVENPKFAKDYSESGRLCRMNAVAIQGNVTTFLRILQVQKEAEGDEKNPAFSCG